MRRFRISDFGSRNGGHGCVARARGVIGNPQSAVRSGFTLTEVLFAVVLLGIGFILVAAMFPVAIQQSRTSTEETMASGMARTAMQYLEQIADESTMPATGVAVRLHHPSGPIATGDLWDHMAGSMINPADQRFAWTALYRRQAATDRSAQVFIITMQARNRATFDALNDTTQPARDGASGPPYPASLEPKAVLVDVQQGNPDRIRLKPAPGTASVRSIENPQAAAAPGAHIIIAGGSHPGTVLRLGNAVNQGGGIWEVALGTDMPGGSDHADVQAFMMGRGYAGDSTRTSIDHPPHFEGPAMDIMVFTGFVRVK